MRSLQEHARRSCPGCHSLPTSTRGLSSHRPHAVAQHGAAAPHSSAQPRHGSHNVEQEGGHVGEGDQALHAARGRVHDEQPPHARHRQPLHHRPARRADLFMIGLRVQALGEKLEVVVMCVAFPFPHNGAVGEGKRLVSTHTHNPARQRNPQASLMSPGPCIKASPGMARPGHSSKGQRLGAPERVARRADVDALQLGRRDAARLGALANADSTCQQCTSLSKARRASSADATGADVRAAHSVHRDGRMLKHLCLP